MNRKYLIANGILWAAAIIASAIVGAPRVLFSCPIACASDNLLTGNAQFY
jgi:hypothetical protein